MVMMGVLLMMKAMVINKLITKIITPSTNVCGDKTNRNHKNIDNNHNDNNSN